MNKKIVAYFENLVTDFNESHHLPVKNDISNSINEIVHEKLSKAESIKVRAAQLKKSIDYVIDSLLKIEEQPKRSLDAYVERPVGKTGYKIKKGETVSDVHGLIKSLNIKFNKVDLTKHKEDREPLVVITFKFNYDATNMPTKSKNKIKMAADNRVRQILLKSKLHTPAEYVYNYGGYKTSEIKIYNNL